MKRIDETKAGQSISAYIVLNKKRYVVSRIRAHWSDSGVCTVEVWNIGEDLQRGKAGGYGYDKFTSALSGMQIDGIPLNDHCGTNDKTKRILSAYHNGKITEEQARKRAEKIGARFANYNSEKNKWDSLYLDSGLDKLRTLGYTVVQAI